MPNLVSHILWDNLVYYVEIPQVESFLLNKISFHVRCSVLTSSFIQHPVQSAISDVLKADLV